MRCGHDGRKKEDQMKSAVVAILAMLSLVGCVPSANSDSERFRAEYEAVLIALWETDDQSMVPLDYIDFVSGSPGRVNRLCGHGDEIVAAACNRRDGWLHNDTVIYTSFDDPCQPIESSSEYAASIIIHELVHIAGYSHGAEMDRVRRIAWDVYLDGNCPNIRR